MLRQLDAIYSVRQFKFIHTFRGLNHRIHVNTTVLSIVNFQRQSLYFLSKFRGHYNRPRQHYFVVASVSNINLCAMVKENPMRYQCKSVLVFKLDSIVLVRICVFYQTIGIRYLLRERSIFKASKCFLR